MDSSSKLAFLAGMATAALFAALDMIMGLIACGA